MELNLLVDRERLEIGDLVGMEEGNIKAQRDVVASCLIDDNGQCLDKEDAIKILNKLNAKQFSDLVFQFMDELRSLPLPTKTRS